MIKIIFVCFASIIIIKVIKNYGDVYSYSIHIYTVIIVTALLLPQFISVFNKVNALFSGEYISSDLVKTAIKLCGITFISTASADICRDAGKSSFAYLIECCGNISVIILIFPLLSDVIEKISEIMLNR